MHNQCDRKEGRAFIIPRARKSIHDHEGHCLIKACNMGRYGMNRGQTSQKFLNTSRPEDERDEVDNVFSKPISPLDTEKKNNRKKSLPSAYQVTDDSDEEGNEIGNVSAGSENNNTNLSRESERFDNSFNNLMLNSSNRSNDLSSVTERENGIQGTLRHLLQSRSKIYNSKLALACFVSFIAVAALFYKVPVANEVLNKSKYDKDGFHHDMRRLAKKYSVTDTSILKVTSGLSTIFDREETGCFIFLHNSQNNGFDETLFNDFVESVAIASARYLRNESDVPPRHIHVDDLDMKVQGELINKYRHELQKNGVMLVKKLEQIPSNLAMAFHYYCDDYSPLAKKSAVFFTLDLAKCAKPSDQKYKLGSRTEKHADVEKCLSSNWKEVPADNIQALLTRVANVIVDLSKVF